MSNSVLCGLARSAAIAGLAILASIAAASPTCAQMALASTDMRLDSDGAGAGTLAVRLTYPASVADYRYLDGAPVVIFLPGGFGPGSLDAAPELARQGFVLVTFLYPGGAQGPIASDGQYDYRGDNCQRAVRDIIRFAEGAATDTLGRTIDDIVPGPVHPGIVGLAPYSNGMIGLITLDRYGSEIPYAPYQSGWENPTSPQIITGDLGANSMDCDPNVDGDGNGIPGDDGKNPWYDPATGYGPISFAVDYRALRFDPVPVATYSDPGFRCPPVVLAGTVFLDGRANGRLDFNPTRPGCLDFDGDGVIEQNEDYRFTGITTFTASCAPKVYFSAEVTAQMQARGIFTAGWPAWIATPAETEQLWPLWDVTPRWAGIAARLPGFKAMTVYSAQDHVQAQDDHPHVRQVMDGMASQELWYRLNADAVYYEAANGTLPAGYVETPANAPVPLGQMKAHAEPVGTINRAMQAAGHAEMADRIHAGCWWPDLTSTLRPTVAPASEVALLIMGADTTTITWAPAAGAFCYDLLRGDVASLARAGGSVVLGGATCIEEDSADTASSDATAPAPGRAFYYIVKPNGLHGTYGPASDGAPRADSAHACRD